MSTPNVTVFRITFYRDTDEEQNAKVILSYTAEDNLRFYAIFQLERSQSTFPKKEENNMYNCFTNTEMQQLFNSREKY